MKYKSVQSSPCDCSFYGAANKGDTTDKFSLTTSSLPSTIYFLPASFPLLLLRGKCNEPCNPATLSILPLWTLPMGYHRLLPSS